MIMTPPVFLFSKFFFFFLDNSILKIFFLIIKINNFRGDLSSISAKKSSLDTASAAGLFARANAVNNNKRLYPKRVLMREVAKYVKDQVKSGCALGELDHPSYSCPTFKYLNLPNVSHQVLSVKWKGNELWGYIQVSASVFKI